METAEEPLAAGLDRFLWGRSDSAITVNFCKICSVGFVEEGKLNILGVEWVNLVERWERNRREKLEGEWVAWKRTMRERVKVFLTVGGY